MTDLTGETADAAPSDADRALAAWVTSHPRRVEPTGGAGDAAGTGGGNGGGGDDGDGASGSPADGGENEERPRFLLHGPNSPMPVANDLLSRWRHVRYVNGKPVRRTVHWRGDWWDWVGTHYQASSDRSVENSLWRVLDEAEYEHLGDADADGNREVQLRRWEPNKTKVSNVAKALEARCEVGDHLDAGTWLRFPAAAWLTPYADPERAHLNGKLVSLANVALDPVTGETYEHDERHLNTYSLPFAYDPVAGCPAWEGYLASILGEDSVRLLQEWFGYVISGRTDLQKMMFMIGPSRSGKGTVALILSSLIGMVNVSGPTMNGFAGQFGLQPLVGKPLAIFDDVRLPPRPDNVYTAIERLLSVIGEAPLTVDRKNKEPVTVKLPTRIMMAANELLQFPDEVGAMQTRMLVLLFTQSFVGREKRDEEFKDLFLAELPGILNWALTGLRRLNEAGGRFTLPNDSHAVSEELRDAGNPVRAFVRDHCELGDTEEHWVWIDELFNLYADTHGGFKDAAAQRERFGRELRAAFPEVKRSRKRRDGVMTYYYDHIRLDAEHRARAAALAEEAEAVRAGRRWARSL